MLLIHKRIYNDDDDNLFSCGNFCDELCRKPSKFSSKISSNWKEGNICLNCTAQLKWPKMMLLSKIMMVILNIVHRKGDGGLHRRLPWKHPGSPRLPRGLLNAMLWSSCDQNVSIMNIVFITLYYRVFFSLVPPLKVQKS